MRHLAVAEVVRLQVQCAAKLRIITNPATPHSRPRAVEFELVTARPCKSRLIQARQEGEARGRQEGRQEGEEIGKARGLKRGRIVLLQELLGGHPTTGEEFSGYDETQFKELEEKLRQQLGNRG